MPTISPLVTCDDRRDDARGRGNGADAVVVLCTNLDGAALAAPLEKDMDITVLDPIAVTRWRTMELAGEDPRILSGWDHIFQASARANRRRQW